jgi:hypothetical protein
MNALSQWLWTMQQQHWIVAKRKMIEIVTMMTVTMTISMTIPDDYALKLRQALYHPQRDNDDADDC